VTRLPAQRPAWLHGPNLFLCVFAALLALPVLALVALAVQWDAQSADVLRQMAQTVLPDYALTSLVLSVSVALGVAVVGMGTACAVTQFDFPGRRLAEWALLLPLAVPAYVVAYAYTDFLQFSGPLQTLLRDTLGVRGRVFPEVRNLGGAVWVFTFTLYPYVYLLARTALTEHASRLMEAARLLGAPLPRRLREIALPLARPAVAAGVALALMETLADFGVASYFGIQTFTAGIYKAWLVMDDRLAAAQLATLLLATVGVLLWLERRSRQRLRFTTGRAHGAHGAEAQPVRLTGLGRYGAWVVCGLPVLAGFVLPVLFMLRPLVQGWGVLPLAMYGQWAGNSLLLALAGAVLATTAQAVWPLGACGFAHRRSGLRRAGRGGGGGPVAARGVAAACGPAGQRGVLGYGHGAGCAVGLYGALYRCGFAVGAKWLCPHPVSAGRLGPHAGHVGRGAAGPGALAAAAPLHRRCWLAGVCRCDEGAARHAGAAPLQLGHAGGGDVPVDTR
jgi:iron(III) transport system permease protein